MGGWPVWLSRGSGGPASRHVCVGRAERQGWPGWGPCGVEEKGGLQAEFLLGFCSPHALGSRTELANTAASPVV